VSEVLDRIVQTREQAHQAITQGYAHAKSILDNGRPARVRVEEHEDDRSEQQNKFYWGPCLGDISEQARIDGQRYTKEAWHNLFKRVFLGYEIVREKVAGRKKTTIIRRLRSTRNLKVRAFSKYLDELQAFAATEHGVRFTVAKWQEYQG